MKNKGAENLVSRLVQNRTAYTLAFLALLATITACGSNEPSTSLSPNQSASLFQNQLRCLPVTLSNPKDKYPPHKKVFSREYLTPPKDESILLNKDGQRIKVTTIAGAANQNSMIYYLELTNDQGKNLSNFGISPGTKSAKRLLDMSVVAEMDATLPSDSHNPRILLLTLTRECNSAD